MSTTVEEQAFLQPILAAFADDGPRHIYADYLDESHRPGDIARAEFIRLQLELGKIDGDHPHRGRLLRRLNQLLIRWQPEWIGTLRGSIAGCEFRRGLLDTVSVDARFFCESGDCLFEGTAVRRVKFLDAERVLDRLVRCPALECVRELDLCGNDLGNGGVNLLLRSPFLKHSAKLDLRENGIGPAGAKAIANAPAMELAWSLDLGGNLLRDAGAIALAESDRLGHLRNLSLRQNRIGDPGARCLAHSELMTRLARLDVSSNRITPRAVELLWANRKDFQTALESLGQFCFSTAQSH